MIALPASAVIAGLTTVAIAVIYSDSLVVDNYYKEGLAINKVLAEDQMAEKLGLSADLAVETDSPTIVVSLSGEMSQWPGELTMLWAHPTDSSKDQTVQLVNKGSGRYEGELNGLESGHWYLQLLGKAPAPWRLSAEINLAQGGNFHFTW